MANFFVANQAQLTKALGRANGGDTITVASTFRSANIYISGFNKAGGLTLTAEDGAQATAGMIKIVNSSGINVRNFDVPQEANKTMAVSIKDSSNVVLSGLHVYGGSDLTKVGVGMLVVGGDSVTVQNSTFDHLTGGISFSRSSHLTLQGNRFSEIVNDGIIGSSSSWLDIKDNYFTNWQHFGLVHPDAIQLFTRPGDAVSHDISISGNVFNRGEGTVTQGIWVKNDAGTAPFENVNITGNTIIGALYNGIGVMGVGSAVVSGNLVQGYDNQESRIITADTRGSVEVRNNTASWFSTNDTRTSFSGNVVASYLPFADVKAITGAIAALANGVDGNASAAIQGYLASISGSLAAVDMAAGTRTTSLPVTGTVADLLAHQDLVRTAGATIAGDNSATVSQFGTLSALGKLGLADGATLTVRGSVAELISFNGTKASHSPLTTGVAITGENLVIAGHAAALATIDHATLDPGATVTVRDWAVNLTKSIDALETAASHGLITSISLNDKAPVLALSDSQYLIDGDVLGLIATPTRQLVTVAAGHSVVARNSAAQLDGSAGHAMLTASDGGNTLIGGDGDTLVGGLGKDTFVMHGHFGHDVVVGFDASDVLQFDRAMVSGLHQLQPKLHQVGSDVVIDLGAGDSVTLAGVDLASLHSANFRFL